MRKNILSPVVNDITFTNIYFRALRLVLVCLNFISFHGYSQAQLIKDLGTDPSYVNEHHSLIAGGRFMYFTNSRHLLRSSGKPATTELVGSFPRTGVQHLTYSNNTVFFISDDGAGSWALWKSNGTPIGTVKVRSIAPTHLPHPDQLIDIEGTLFFVATTESHGRELWKSNGTPTGTVVVKDIIGGAGSSDPASLTYLRGKLFFSADDGLHGRELWTSDGTIAGTRLFKDIRPGANLGSDASELTNVKGTLYFAASDGTTGKELWKSNGTVGGTVFVKDIRRGPEGADIENMTAVNDLLFFSANDGVHGDELWKSNGIRSGTVLVKDLNPGPEGSNSSDPLRYPMGSFTNVNGVLYFTASKGANDYIYRSNGTPVSTFIIQQAYGANSLGFNPAFRYFNNYVYFFNPTGPNSDDSYNLWRMHYKGTNPVVVKEFGGHADFFDGYHQELLRFGGALYFFVRPVPDGWDRLMISDGTAQGTRVLEDPRLSSSPAEIVKAGNLLYIRTNPNTGDFGELYRTDGTASGTFSYGIMRENEEMKAIGNKLFFTANDGFVSSLFVTEGTLESTTRLVPGSVAGRTSYLLTVVNGSLYYHNDDGELWRTNGTAGDQVLIGHIPNIIKIDDVNGQAFMFTAPNETTLELWRTTAAGPPVHVKTINSNFYMDPYSPLPDISTASIGGVFYFAVSDGVHGEVMWRSDGTALGTFVMFNTRTSDETGDMTDPEDDIKALTVYNDNLYFNARSDDDTWGWYQATGDHAYVKLANIPPATRTLVHNNLIYIIAEPIGDDPTVELWVSDGTQDGTQLMGGFHGGGAADHAIIDNIIYFSTQEGSFLLGTDGTQCRTFGLLTGTENAFPIEALGHDLIFGGFTRETGTEPFIYRNINNDALPSTCEEASADAAARSTIVLTPYPNPFTSEFTLRINSPDTDHISIKVFTTSGSPVETFNDIRANTDYLHVGARWPEGMYVLKVNVMGQISTHLVMKR